MRVGRRSLKQAEWTLSRQGYPLESTVGRDGAGYSRGRWKRVEGHYVNHQRPNLQSRISSVAALNFWSLGGKHHPRSFSPGGLGQLTLFASKQDSPGHLLDRTPDDETHTVAVSNMHLATDPAARAPYGTCDHLRPLTEGWGHSRLSRVSALNRLMPGLNRECRMLIGLSTSEFSYSHPDP